MTITLTRESVTKAMQESVAERGADYVYSEHFDAEAGCSYVINGQPACLIADVLNRLGVDLAPLDQTQFAHAPIRAIDPDDLDIEDSGDELDLIWRGLGEAQSYQDSSSTWGEALKGFVEEINA